MSTHRRLLPACVLLAGTLSLGLAPAAQAQGEIDNSALESAEFRPHQRTFGLVFTLPEEVNARLARTIAGPLRERLLNAGLLDEAARFNIPHVTALHIHNPDPSTPEKMLAALPELPGPVEVVLKAFKTTEAAKGAGRPWWFDLGIVKEGAGYQALMDFNIVATAALTPLRDGPLPRVTGPVYAAMGEAARELVQTVGVSGVNTVKDGEALLPHNPHTTLVYSMAPFTPELQADFDELAAQADLMLPEGIATTFHHVSIVELGFAGNVLREVYRISLDDGSVLDVGSGQVVSR